MNHKALRTLAPSRPDRSACLLFLGLAPATPVCLLPVSAPGSHLALTYPKLPESSAPWHQHGSLLLSLGNPSKTALHWCPPSLSALAPDSYHCLKPGYRPERPGARHVPGR